jgi:hypothetical protein
VPPAPSIVDFEASSSYIIVEVKPPDPPYDYLITIFVFCVGGDNATLNQHQEAPIVQNSVDVVNVVFNNVQAGTEYSCSVSL